MELSEAINAMYKWYEKSEVCYAYLHDVSDPSEFTKSDWFLRGWTLQELIAPKVLKFFTNNWTLIGTREGLIDTITEQTGISREILWSGKIPPEVISQRMFWAAKRDTTKVEDKAYSLLGILGVHMVPIYGIDDVAFEELQHKIIVKYPDQTLFAWCYTPQPEDVEMGDANTPVTSPTGLLASSPSQFPVSYDIDEDDFRTNYLDRIGFRDHMFQPYFNISNNLVNISLPIKYVTGKIWKAILRCSFEPPGDEPQCPLVIYLEEIQPLKFVRVHLARNEEEGDNQTDDVNSIPGSLEWLSDVESKLEGYILRTIHVIGRHLEGPSDDRPRPPPGDPDSLPELSEAERIAQLPRYPPGVKTTNVIVCGEPGVAAGRVVNLVVDKPVIKPLTDYDREAMAVTVIDFTLQSKNIRIFYTIGPRDPFLDLDIYHTAIRNMYQLVQLAEESTSYCCA
ncbi:hypothetical protein J3R82DRAFT_6855 [Butyriboletus roseoflavus]|nr:hypothetical protein J3R82DRAFT_6855 [Butyriboletus roseoflavus]